MQGVAGTAEDAARGKWDAVQMGYYSDPKLETLVSHARRHLPLVRRGYAARVRAVEARIKVFSESGGKQVAILGCGLDALGLRLQEQGFGVVDVDLPQVCAERRKRMGSSEEPAGYRLVEMDLTHPEPLPLDPALPTLFVMECVLGYLEERSIRCVLSWIAASYVSASLCVYDVLLGTDPFGEEMERQYRDRGVPLLGGAVFRSKTVLHRVVVASGFADTRVDSMAEAEAGLFTDDDRATMQRIDPLDEFEEYDLLQSHYCIIHATNATS